MKVYERTENGVTAHVSLIEGRDEIEAAQWSSRRDTKSVSGGARGWWIEYKDGRKVKLVQVDAPQEPAEATLPNIQTHTGAIHAPGRYDKTLRTRAPKCCTSRSALLRYHYLADVEGEVTCKRCLAALATSK